MKLITERTLIREMAERWATQYPRGKSEPGSSSQRIYKKLLALDKEKATAKDVADIVGNDSWTRVCDCSECGTTPQVIVQVGEEPDYESRTAYLCPSCLQKAVKLVQKGDGDEASS